MNKSKQNQKQEVLEDSETTENEFSELDIKNEVRKRVIFLSILKWPKTPKLG